MEGSLFSVCPTGTITSNVPLSPVVLIYYPFSKKSSLLHCRMGRQSVLGGRITNETAKQPPPLNAKLTDIPTTQGRKWLNSSTTGTCTCTDVAIKPWMPSQSPECLYKFVNKVGRISVKIFRISRKNVEKVLSMMWSLMCKWRWGEHTERGNGECLMLSFFPWIDNQSIFSQGKKEEEEDIHLIASTAKVGQSSLSLSLYSILLPHPISLSPSVRVHTTSTYWL